VLWLIFILASTQGIKIYRQPRAHDYRTHRDRTQRRTDAFEGQMSAMVEAYMALNWMHSWKPPILQDAELMQNVMQDHKNLHLAE
jgi:hypothetical protein